MDQESSFHCMAKSTVAGGTDRCRLFSSQTNTHATCAIATLRATLYLGYAATLTRCGRQLSPPFCACRYSECTRGRLRPGRETRASDYLPLSSFIISRWFTGGF